MKTAVFSSKLFDETSLRAANDGSQQLDFFKVRLEESTTVLANGYQAVCVFVNDRLDGAVIDALADAGVRLIALRCAGYNNVDLKRAQARGLCVVRVPAYSPHAVAEFAAGLLLALNRRLYKAYNRVREGNFELQGLMGFDLYGKTVTVIGTGKIGAIFAQIMHGFGCRLLAVDSYHNPDVLKLGAIYVPLAQALPQSDVISLHCPLTPETHHLISEKTLEFLKPGVLLVNTGRGALLDSRALIIGLKSGVLGGLALDVYEEEDKLFFDDHSAEIIPDDTFMRLTTFPNVLITGHQAFFTKEALEQIARTTIANLKEFEATGKCANATAA
jgi:D-lactate dehydrogenase